MTTETALRGKWGEEVAAAFLAAKGYAIRERNWHMRHYELDIVAQDGNEIIFVEVKTRNSNSDAIDAVDKRKRARMIASAGVYFDAVLDDGKAYEYRFDIIGVTGDAASYEIEHIPDAFLPHLRSY